MFEYDAVYFRLLLNNNLVIEKGIIIKNILCKKRLSDYGIHRVRMMLQDSQDPADRQEIVRRGTSTGLKFEVEVKIPEL